MKKTLFLFALLITAIIVHGQGNSLKPAMDTVKHTKTISTQNIKINEPEFDGIILYVNDTVGNGIRLEKQMATIKSSGYFKTLTTGKSSSGLSVKKCCSSVRISDESSIRFIVPLAPNIDPVDYIKFFKLKSEKDSRIEILATANMLTGMGLSSAKMQDVEMIHFDYKKYGQKSYIITIDRLIPGEYAITLNNISPYMFFLFGVQ